MAYVASCPQCDHDLLVPDDTDPQTWAKCPECRAFFQLNQVVLRELPALLPVESQSPDTLFAPSTDTEISPSGAPTDAEEELPQTVVAGEEDVETAIAPPKSSDEFRAAAERIDDWFRSNKTVPDAPPIVASPTGVDLHGDIEMNRDIELADPLASPQSPAAWDDSHHIDRLLADIDTPPADKPTAADEISKAPEGGGSFAETVAATSVADVPMFVKPTSGRPRRKRSLVRMVATIAVAGVVGSALGYYALLWLRGPSGDFLDLAQYLPAMVLPAELQAKPRQVPGSAPPSADALAQQPELATADPAEAQDDSAEIQAAYTTTDESPPAKSQAGDDRYGTETASAPAPEEPAPVEVPAVAPLREDATTADAPRVANAPSFTADELAAALQAAKDAQPSLVAGNLEDGREVQRAKGYSYSLLADLAQKATFVDASSTSESIAPSQQATDELFRQTLSDAHTRSEVALILPKWIASPHRKHGGVFFAASLTNQQNAGSVIECSAALETGQSLTILVPATLADRLDDSSRPLGIVGSIIDQPAEHVTGYTGSAPQAVWVSTLIPLE